ncbi:MAG: RagB/SusD family nutrient uptake outer membrane protein [Gemmatimonadetes bacterium]|nr:RagB/SusD family nutrient uptake outer membrane protein [Gemmatimonadota bacterium]
MSLLAIARTGPGRAAETADGAHTLIESSGRRGIPLKIVDWWWDSSVRAGEGEADPDESGGAASDPGTRFPYLLIAIGLVVTALAGATAWRWHSRRAVRDPPGDDDDLSTGDRHLEAVHGAVVGTIDAMLARYYLMTENYDAAFTAAQRVDLSLMSVYPFTTSDSNPLWNLWYNSGNAFQMRAEEAFRDEAEAGDERIDYWTEEADIEGANGPLDHILRYQERTASFPFYLPDEMRLIMAEVHARRGELERARELVNEVRTPCTSPLDEPVACLPPLEASDVPTQDALLDEILRQRRYELYLTGLRWSDLKRFGEPVKYAFVQVPRSECDRNANVPAELCVTR